MVHPVATCNGEIICLAVDNLVRSPKETFNPYCVMVENTQFPVATTTEDIVIKEARLNGIIHPIRHSKR